MRTRGAVGRALRRYFSSLPDIPTDIPTDDTNDIPIDIPIPTGEDTDESD